MVYLLILEIESIFLKKSKINKLILQGPKCNNNNKKTLMGFSQEERETAA